MQKIIDNWLWLPSKKRSYEVKRRLSEGFREKHNLAVKHYRQRLLEKKKQDEIMAIYSYEISFPHIPLSRLVRSEPVIRKRTSWNKGKRIEKNSRSANSTVL